ncbi:nuclear transport factor 2 family protein [Mucilaginibacter auburnensis]|uniref:Uncharacterized protein DUF4440 n=1 Tax=Mucilaginibacter auburnensis TaxID=1457233 RepID=A0A2H9VS48_9SPHI|nr:nuclear transport factor 2 family protein [Mucilaginibacter auburnensis]PJJ83641.1 uncharacterized protein DUF4440 [Mucilaginibacter auburnensis]
MKIKSHLLITVLCSVSFLTAKAQIDTVSFPKERTEIKAIVHSPGNSALGKDIIMVGAKGDISFTQEELKGARAQEKLVFKSVTPVAGSEFIRIYNANTAIVNWLAAVELQVDGHDVSLKVRRIEVYIKKDGKWNRVAGQGTEVDQTLFPNPH